MTKCLLVAALVLSGCSPVARISANSNEIRTEAQLLMDHGQATGDTVVVAGATRIDGLAAGIHAELPGVEDKTPPWMALVGWIALSVIAVAVVIILFQTGLGSAIRIAIGWIPRKPRQEAELAVNMLDPDKPENAREFIAARRASDPYFNAAFKNARAVKETP
jgi:hypothetical protein